MSKYPTNEAPMDRLYRRIGAYFYWSLDYTRLILLVDSLEEVLSQPNSTGKVETLLKQTSLTGVDRRSILGIPNSAYLRGVKLSHKLKELLLRLEF